jgi:hypothetical protein
MDASVNALDGSFETREPMAFQGFPKIHRLSRDIIVTEKIDGTNAQVAVSDDGTEIMAGSRNQWLGEGKENAGFYTWVQAHKEELLRLGPGRHFGEWWGAGIQRRYGIGEKRFSLFNTERWGDEATRPKCCHVVPILYHGPFLIEAVDACLAKLKAEGSVASPGFMNPEGVVVFHSQSHTLFKKTLDSNDEHKG